MAHPVYTPDRALPMSCNAPTPCDSSPFAHDPEALPASVVTAAHDASRFAKSTFFRLLRGYKSNYTKAPYRSPHRVTAVHGGHDHGRLPTMCVIGDSIAEEIHRSLMALLQPLVGEQNIVFMTRSAGMLTSAHIVGCEAFATNATSQIPAQYAKRSRGCRQCDVLADAEGVFSGWVGDAQVARMFQTMMDYYVHRGAWCCTSRGGNQDDGRVYTKAPPPLRLG